MGRARKSEDQARPNVDTVAELRSYAERIVRIEDERKALAGDIKEVKNEAAARGFDKKALAIVVTRMRETDEERAARDETAALADVYLASLGMLDGTPLGDSARRRFDPIDDPDGHAAATEDTIHQDEVDDEAPTSPSNPPVGAMSEETIAAARAEGSAAAAAGERVFANPYVAGDPRRAAWDEGWCVRKGSDGMEIPDAFRRKKKPAGEDAGEGAAS
jgi:uncharacterized protein (UPF0335 family)